MPRQPIITLTTDFGMHDGYVGAMKGVILGICPNAQLVDITHTIAPQDVRAAMMVLETFPPYFPEGTVHLVVVDPGVGSDRRAIVLATPHEYYVGPDNGVLGQVWLEALARWREKNIRAIELNQPRYWLPRVSATFHGRDIFSPVAAHLAAGVPLQELGTPVDMLKRIPLPVAFLERGGLLLGQIIAVDHFGNCISNLTTESLSMLLAPLDEVEVVLEREDGELRFPVCRTYADRAAGEPLALVGSSQRLEIAINGGNASKALSLGVGSPFQVISLRGVAPKLIL
jgi:S-adenosyl-L-methionine hydrolase (adenosine-forming)